MTPLTLNPSDLKTYSKAKPTVQMNSNEAALRKSAKEIESLFVSQMMEHMWKDVKVNEFTGGGQGEKIFRSFMVDEYGKEIASSGQLGIADTVLEQLLQYQEEANGVE